MPGLTYKPRDNQYIATAEFYVRYAETDAQGIVHHSSYILWIEEARINFARSVGIQYAETEREGRFMSIIEIQTYYHAPMRFGDLARASCWLESFKSRTMSFAYHIRRAGDESVCMSGISRHVCLNREGNIASWPESRRSRLTRTALS